MGTVIFGPWISYEKYLQSLDVGFKLFVSTFYDNLDFFYFIEIAFSNKMHAF